MHSSDRLITAVRTLPMPGAPPSYSASGAWIGLAFLETALRQNHVRRLSESLSLLDHGVAERKVELDVSLNLLDELQSQAGLTYSTMRTRRAHGSASLEQDRLLWVPIARLSRASAAPVDVRGADGLLVPRLTQSETGRLLGSGMFQLLRSIIRADPRAAIRDHDLWYFLNSSPEARWLVQMAVMTMFQERALPGHAHVPQDPQPPGRQGPQVKQRDLACRVLQEYPALFSAYFQLLKVAVSDYLVVVGLPNSHDEHHLQYSAPLRARTEAPRGRVGRVLRELTPGWRGYRVSYATSLPSTIRSYHLAASAGPTLVIEKLVVSTDADRRIATTLSDDLQFLSEQLSDRERKVPTHRNEKILELELETTARAVAQLTRRREWEAQQAGGHLHRERLAALRRLADIAVSGHAYPTATEEFRSSLLVNPQITPGLLHNASKEIRENLLERDLTHEAASASNRADAYWRHPANTDGNRDSYEIRASLLVTDAAGTGATSVGRFVLGVIAVTYAVAASLYGGLLPWRWQGGTQPVTLPGAIIGVLLLVPGYLYSRLEMPGRTSITARLRLLPRLSAYLSIATIALLAAYLATNPTTAQLRLAFWLSISVQLVFALAMILRHGLKTPGADLGQWEVAAAAPRWLYHPAARRVPRRAYRGYDVHYTAGAGPSSTS